MVVEQTFEREGGFTRSVDIQQHTFRDALPVAQHRQVALLAIAERVTIGHHPNDQSFVFIRHIDVESDREALASLHPEVLLLLANDLLRFRDEEFHSHNTLHFLIGEIHQRGRQLHLIPHADEARKVRLKHEFLAGHHLVGEASVIHIASVCQTHELPFGQAFRQGELNAHFAIGIGA